MVLGGVGVAATASKTRFEIVTSGSGPIDQAGNCMSYLARLGMPNVCWMKSFWYRWATPMAARIVAVPNGPRRRSTLSTVTSFS